MSQSRLHELIGSRICHDLISPLGAIGNGLELIGLSGQELGPELRLVSESVENANARIRFFRVAFGLATREQMFSAAEARAILRDVNLGNRTQTHWDVDGDQPRLLVKLAFLLIQCLETAMPRGGLIRVTELGGEWSVGGEAEKMSIDPDIWQALSKPNTELSLRADKVQFALAPLVAAEADRQMRFESANHSARLRF